ncbi:tetratricopeptide repeat protein [Pontibacter ummariensis]|uniref:histidine kinase n=1 Tax=Pontibacter ummariensis TaxID=1610492 RepID=A0A239D827_9BACT|nr:tetratricopeptide repeat protein [Pontibacter ummariensis]PRY14298.1 tetratricopeptide repeat protein [Pontibacter ummariensis]SNS28535.1 Tetratricopeptide repeat-containing protein [Pontibacter ummariensis]
MMLQKEIASAPTETVDLLNQQAWELRVSNSARAFELSKEALDLAEGMAYTKGKAEAARTYGFCHIRLSEHGKAAFYLEEALQLFQELGDVKGQSDVLEYRGIICRSQGDYAASLDYLYRSLEIREQAAYQDGISLTHYHLGITYRYIGNYNTALDHLLKSLEIAREINFWVSESYALNSIGVIYFENDDFDMALEYFLQSLAIRRAHGDKWGEAGCLDNLGNAYVKLDKYEEALLYCKQSQVITERIGDKKGYGNTLFHLGNIYLKLKDYQKALDSWRESQSVRVEINDKKGQAEILCCLSELYCQPDFAEVDASRAISFLEAALLLGKETQAKDVLSKIHYRSYEVLKQLNAYDQALNHLEEHLALEKEVHNEAIQRKIVNLEIYHRVEQAKKETEIFRLRNIELSGLNQAIKEQKEKLELQRDALVKALTELNATQEQLIQREKLASLGELTAGIAHEIQNPLNFMNNFSEVSAELLTEMEEVVGAGRVEELLPLVKDLTQNLQKIREHGTRADSIVKNMLQHSRKSTGQKERIAINSLAEEYLRLAYHGFRAKDKSFNVVLVADLDRDLKEVEVVPQDLGRVLLNLFSNAFYAVQQRQKQEDDDYQPQVSLITRQLADAVEIKVKDNGPGIPAGVRSKIFQPFFTTKPTGMGTGLGLSLSYDIVRKGHGGSLDVNTEEGEFTEFIIRIPIKAGSTVLGGLKRSNT